VHRRDQRWRDPVDPQRGQAGTVSLFHRESLRRLAALLAGHGNFGRQGSAEEEGQRHGAVPRIGAVSLQRSQSALGAAFRRTARREGYSVVVFSLARKLAILIYRVPRYGKDYLACGEAESEARFQRQRLAGITAAANSLGFELVARAATPA